MPRAANAIDFWRGFALITIFVNHIPGWVFEHFTHKNVSLSDSAELFVFLAGWSLRHVVGRPEDPTPTSQLVIRLTGRAIVIYAAHVTTVTIAIAMLAGAALYFDNPLMLEWHNASAVFSNPAETHIGLVLLSHQLGYFDILPLYVLLMIVAPFVALLHRAAPALLLPLSFAIYLAALVGPISIPTWPVPGQWFFNPLCWQFVFVLGFSMSRERGPGGFVRKNMTTIRLIAAPLLLALTIVSWNNWLPNPATMPEPKLLFIAGKTFVTPIRLMQFLALVAVFSIAFPFLQRFLPQIVNALAMLGRNSLQVFCVGSLLSLAGQITRYNFDGTLPGDVAILAVGIATLLATAWLAEARSKSERSRA
jgi:hypothetical protein